MASQIQIMGLAKMQVPEMSLVTRNKPLYEKTGFLHMRKQRRRSAAQ